MIQSYLTSSLPTAVYERLSEERNAGSKNEFLWNRDQRIKLGVYMHESITRFCVDAKGNEVVTLGGSDVGGGSGFDLGSGNGNGGSHDGGIDEFFWCAQIRNLSNLVHLDLHLVTTDAILAVIGDVCRSLQTVNVESRIVQVRTT